MSVHVLAAEWALGALASVAAVAGLGDLGLPVGMEQVTGGVVAFLILREVFDFVRERRKDSVEHDDGAYRLQVQRDIHDVLRQQTEILARMEDGQAQILTITKQYQATGICPLTDPMERQQTIRDIGAEARKPRHG